VVLCFTAVQSTPTWLTGYDCAKQLVLANQSKHVHVIPIGRYRTRIRARGVADKLYHANFLEFQTILIKTIFNAN